MLGENNGVCSAYDGYKLCSGNAHRSAQATCKVGLRAACAWHFSTVPQWSTGVAGTYPDSPWLFAFNATFMQEGGKVSLQDFSDAVENIKSDRLKAQKQQEEEAAKIAAAKQIARQMVMQYQAVSRVLSCSAMARHHDIK